MFNLFGYDPSGRPLHIRPDAVTPDQALFFPEQSTARNIMRINWLISFWEAGSGRKEAITPAFLAVLGHPPDEPSALAALGYVADSLRDQLSEKEALSRLISGLFSCDDFTHLYSMFYEFSKWCSIAIFQKFSKAFHFCFCGQTHALLFFSASAALLPVYAVLLRVSLSICFFAQGLLFFSAFC